MRSLKSFKSFTERLMNVLKSLEISGKCLVNSYSRVLAGKECHYKVSWWVVRVTGRSSLPNADAIINGLFYSLLWGKS